MNDHPQNHVDLTCEDTEEEEEEEEDEEASARLFHLKKKLKVSLDEGGESENEAAAPYIFGRVSSLTTTTTTAAAAAAKESSEAEADGDDVANEQSDDDDDLVEFMFVLPPDTSASNSKRAASVATTTTTASTSISIHHAETHNVMTQVSTSLAAEELSSPSVSMPKQQQQQPQQYTPLMSAYVQSLAETAYSVLHDARWCVFATTTRSSTTTSATTTTSSKQPRRRPRVPLFRWEQGEDLAAVLWFARRCYSTHNTSNNGRRRQQLQRQQQNRQPISSSKRRGGQEHEATTGCSFTSVSVSSFTDESSSSTSSSCWLCRNQKVPADKNIKCDQQQQDEAAGGDKQHPCAEKEDDVQQQQQERLEDEPSDRSLYLYARLFYRKGPWFRLDDVFWRYYANTTAFTINSTSNTATTAKQEQNNNPDGVLDETRVEHYIQKLVDLLEDVQCLSRKGLLRDFEDEAECGTTIDGAHFSHHGGRGLLLNKEERAAVLAKLGVRKPTGKPNEIWTQMRTQRAIFGVKQSNNNNNYSHSVLLPVRKHVNQVLQNRLLQAIIVKSCSTATTPNSSNGNNTLSAAVMKRSVSLLQSRLLKRLQLHGNNESRLLWCCFCFRLREAPALTLQRCVRLYVCATAGPGEMRGIGNGWTSLRKDNNNNGFSYPKQTPPQQKEQGRNRSLPSPPPPLSRLLPPPGIQRFYQVSHPGLAYRFGLRSAVFRDSYSPYLLVASDDSDSVLSPSSRKEDNDDGGSDIRVFFSHESFLAWEISVEVRAQVDYLIELHETMRVNERRQNRGLPPKGGDGGGVEQSPSSPVVAVVGSVDFLGLLVREKRNKLVQRLLLLPTTSECSGVNKNHQLDDLLQSIEMDLQRCVTVSEKKLPLTEPEKVLMAIAVMGFHVLAFRNRTIILDPHECEFVVKRPWLRNLAWESVIAYAVWDIIPVLERRDLYRIATMALETLLWGAPLERESTTLTDLPTSLTTSIAPCRLAPVLLSRRSRGKGYDRLIIDYNHILSQDMKKDKKDPAAKDRFKARRDEILRFCEAALRSSLGSSYISFSSIRGLARRLKRPLSQTIGGEYCLEAVELGLRYDNISVDDAAAAATVVDPTINSKRYSDWTPRTDTAVANSLSNGSNHTGVGSRCSFVGFEDDDDDGGGVDAGSLTVEQLAMEYYRTGRLPLLNRIDDNDGSIDATHQQQVPAGGWLGWHDEGGSLRALFRILCAPVLGMDWCCNCCQQGVDPSALMLQQHLTPYQLSPFDLHVGFSVSQDSNDVAGANTGYYFHRRTQIDSFLVALSKSSPQQLSDGVYDSIATRRAYFSLSKDPFGEKDCQRVRTLSLVAAACGGPQLANIFRCLFFDYRHYSGGLPDLLLVRATMVSNSASPSITDAKNAPKCELVPLEEWIGEGTLVSGGSNNNSLRNLLADDEFLGCSKMSDAPASSSSSARSAGSRRQQSREGSGGGGASSSNNNNDNSTDAAVSTQNQSEPAAMSQRLELAYNNRPVRVECLLVEVKSSNDRLDPRQEDWLNILDRHGCGNARVCKFVKSLEST